MPSTVAISKTASPIVGREHPAPKYHERPGVSEMAPGRLAQKSNNARRVGAMINKDEHFAGWSATANRVARSQTAPDLARSLTESDKAA